MGWTRTDCDRWGRCSAVGLLSRSVRPADAASQRGAPAVLGKLSELLFVDTIRSYVGSQLVHHGCPKA